MKKLSDIFKKSNDDVTGGVSKVKKVSIADTNESIRKMRDKFKDFATTNDKDTYVILQFSCKDDKYMFCNSVGQYDKATFIDGYEVAERFKIAPSRPKKKLMGLFK